MGTVEPKPPKCRPIPQLDDWMADKLDGTRWAECLGGRVFGGRVFGGRVFEGCGRQCGLLFGVHRCKPKCNTELNCDEKSDRRSD